jgi:hypothetical protein
VSARAGFTLKVTLAAAGQVDVKVYELLTSHHRTAARLKGLVDRHALTVTP